MKSLKPEVLAELEATEALINKLVNQRIKPKKIETLKTKAKALRNRLGQIH